MNDRLMRSLLYVPGQNEKLVTKAAAGSADVIVIDFEDAVPAEVKPVARERLVAHAELITASGKEVAVRVNAEQELLALDIPTVLASATTLLILPKVESAQQVQTVAERLEGSQVGIIGLIESPKGLLNVTEIAAAHPRLLALSIGTEDLSFDMQMTPCWDSLLVPSMQVNIACKAAGIELLGYVGSIAEFRDIEAFETSVMRSTPLGFTGGFAIHPAQVEVLNRAFSPCREDVAHARRVVEAFAKAQGEGTGAIAVDGKMVDLPVALRAEKLLLRSRLIESRAEG